MRFCLSPSSRALKRNVEACTSGISRFGKVLKRESKVSPPSLLIAYARLPGSVPRSLARA